MALAGAASRDEQWVRRLRTLTVGLLTPFYFIRAGSLVSVPTVVSAPLVLLLLLGGKVVAKILGLYPVIGRFRRDRRERWYYTLLMSTGLTFGTISALYGFFAGDAVNYGPDPRRVIAWLRNQGAIAVRGNHDHAIAFGTDPRASPAKQPLAIVMRDWTHMELDFDERTWLARLPLHLMWECHGVRIAVYHATPHDPLFDYRFVPMLPRRRVKEIVAGVDADVLVVGHTHLPFIRRSKHLSIVNPGSVGQPLDGDPRAAFALWEDGRITLERAEYDVTAAIAALRDVPLSPQPVETLIQTLATGRIREPPA